MPTGVRKPKQKASVEGSEGKIATAIIAKLRNEIFTSLEELCDRARDIGPKTFEVVRRMFDEAKIKEQVSQNVQAILGIAEQFSTEILEKACDKSLKKYHIMHMKFLQVKQI